MIPENLYKQILEHVPVFCIDFLLYHDGKVLLTKRTDEPVKNVWWNQGGRLLKNESFEEALKRLSIREVGFEVEIVKQIGIYNFKFDKGKYQDLKTGTHTPALCFLVKPKEGVNLNDINLDHTHSEYRWIDHMDESLHPLVKQVINDSKVFQYN